MFSLKKFLVGKYVYLVWFVFVRVVGNQGYVSRECIHWKIFEQIGIGEAYLFNDNAWSQIQRCIKGLRIHIGMDEMYEIVHQATYRFFGNDQMHKVAMDEMYQWNVQKFKFKTLLMLLWKTGCIGCL